MMRRNGQEMGGGERYLGMVYKRGRVCKRRKDKTVFSWCLEKKKDSR